MEALKIAKEIIRENSFKHNKKKPGLSANRLSNNWAQYFKHRSEYSVREIYLTIGQTIKEMILEQVREAGIYGLFADDATDIEVIEQMVTFVSYIDPLPSQWEVKFLFIEDVLDDPEAEGANAGVLLKVLLT